jgi:translocation and assembly module TamB
MDVSGQFSLGYPRRDGGEEIDARVRVTTRTVKDFLAAFDLEDYDIDGLVSGDFHLYGQYTQPFGFGRLVILQGTAYGESFAEGAAALRFEGNGVRLDGLTVLKGGTTVTGAAYVGWNGTYSFEADARGMAVETMAAAAVESGPGFTGLFDFAATGSGTFDQPRYDVKFGVRDLFYGDEGVGEVTGRLSVRDTVLVYELEAASTRLAASGTGRIALTDQMDAELSFRVTDTSLDPYLRAFQPQLSPFTSAIASGAIRVVGELANPDALRVDVDVDAVQLRFFDYVLKNAEAIKLSVDRQVLHLDALRLVGEDTELDLAGSVDLPKQELALTANGAANLAVLQGFLRDVRTSGRAEVAARVTGAANAPVVSGTALLSEGRLRHFGVPHALEALNGVVTFNATGVRLDGLRGRLAGGTVTFGGRIGFSGYALSEFDVTATGTDMRPRFPEGMRSLVDAELALRGSSEAPVLSGLVQVKNALWSRPFDTSGGLFDFADSTEAAATSVDGALPEQVAGTISYDLRLVAPSTLHIENDQARIVASADLNLRGTFDRPVVLGRADIEQGDVRFEGRRYLVTRGSLDFTNPDRLQPFFDVEAETRVRVPGQTYRVTLRMAGTTERLQPEFTSDPPLPPLEILTMLFSDSTPSGDVELAAQQRPNEREQRLLEARATRALTGTLSAEVGRVVQETFGVDSFQITPLLVDPYQQSARLNVNPSARVTIGKRISDRIYLTYARSLSSSTRDEIILLEFDQSETLAWVLSQNEDRTYALEVRKRHAF